MESFLERYTDELAENLNDPATSTRLTTTQKLRLLRAIEKQVWERLQVISGVGGSLGYTETEYDLKSEKDYYNLPGNFRQFHRFEQRTDGNKNLVTDYYPSGGPRDTYKRIEIVSGNHGFLVHPVPTADSSTPYTLVYTKGPLRLHRSSSTSVSSTGLVGILPDTLEKGEAITRTDYYKGALLRIYSGNGAPQTREILQSGGGADIHFVVRHAWDPIPTGTVLYEITPTLPEDYDSIYALDAAIRVLTRRGQISKRRELIRERTELWNACMNYYLSNASDSSFQKQVPYAVELPDAGYDDGWSY